MYSRNHLQTDLGTEVHWSEDDNAQRHRGQGPVTKKWVFHSHYEMCKNFYYMISMRTNSARSNSYFLACWFCWWFSCPS